jgi:methionyl-tRNA formyltransferase
MKVIFMGTPSFSCPTLEKLICDAEFEIVGVYTKEPQISGRGQKITNSPIHDLALKHELRVFTPKSLRDVSVQKEFANLGADVSVVVAYGLLLPQEILDAPKFGCLNIHPSLLPRWRGASPIQRPIMEGDKETGITIIKMDKGLDSGDMIYQESFALNGSETCASLSKKFSDLGAEILVKTLKELKKGNISFIKQNDALVTYAKKIEKSECEIDWKKSAAEIERNIRGLNGSLGAYFIHNEEKIKIFSAEILNADSSENAAGEILDDKLSIQCKKGILRPLILQRPGKKPMELSEFLLGFRVNSKSLS